MKENLSKNQLMRAYLDLIKKKPAEEIKITELCKCASVPRSTFYANFQNLAELEKYVQDYVIQLGVDCFRGDNIEKNITDYLTTIRSNDRIFKTLLFSDSNQQSGRPAIFTTCLEDSIMTNLGRFPMSSEIDPHIAMMMTHYYTYGALAIIRYWMSIDYVVPVSTVKDLILTLPAKIVQ